MSRRAPWILGLIVVAAAFLRFHALGTSPPGMHPDAASNAWNARCLLAAGRDWSGAPWPVLTSRGFGQGQSTLYYYALMPFQALAGMTPASTAMPSALTGAVSIVLIYLAGARLFGGAAGLLAAALTAVTPWHLFLSRWGHESGIVPFLAAAPLAALVAARLPFTERDPGATRPWPALGAGLAVGFACFGYLALRVFWPAALALAAAANARAFAGAVRDRRGRLAVLAFALGLLATLGPLAWRHLTDPMIGKRAGEYTAWSADDPIGARIAKVAARYPGTLGPDFLFVHGDRFGIHGLPESGPLGGYVAPLLLAGLAALVAAARTDPGARTVAALLVAYPLADALARHDGPHLLRSAPGIVPIALVAGLGGVRAWAWLGARRRAAAWGAAGLLGLWCVVSTARFAATFYGAYNRNATTWQYFNADLLEAISWVKPRFPDADALYISMSVSSAMDQPFVLALVGLDYDPQVWFRDRTEVLRRENTDVVRAVGKVRFLFDAQDAAALSALAFNDRQDRVLIIARPGEWRSGVPVHTVLLPDGRPSFLIYDVRL